MALIKPKTRKAILKEVKRLIIKHGTEVAVGLLSGLITKIFADAVEETDKPKKKKAKK
ncbi:hypothetical protein [Hymenobacter sedentarius]|uniref:hypothetical protein n=1 Tax=Hymenobacter sedentarius TaxID=1411621 RepID=UPI000ABE6B50|nr:hypothetical protein [Hymenobacter sedentarius]